MFLFYPFQAKSACICTRLLRWIVPIVHPFNLTTRIEGKKDANRGPKRNESSSCGHRCFPRFAWEAIQTILKWSHTTESRTISRTTPCFFSECLVALVFFCFFGGKEDEGKNTNYIPSSATKNRTPDWPETIEYCQPSLRRCQHLRQESSPKSSLDGWGIGGFIGNSGLQLDILNIVSKSTSSYSEIATIGDSPTWSTYWEGHMSGLANICIYI